MKCTQVETQYIAYIRGELSPDIARKIAEHLTACPACAHNVERLRNVYQALPELPVYAPPADVAHMAARAIDTASASQPVYGMWRSWAFATAGLLVLLGIGFVLSGRFSAPGSLIANQHEMGSIPHNRSENLPVTEGPASRPETPATHQPDGTGRTPARAPRDFRIAEARPETNSHGSGNNPDILIMRSLGHDAGTTGETGKVEKGQHGTAIVDSAALLAKYLVQDLPFTPSSGEVRCGMLPVSSQDEEAASVVTERLSRELARQLPDITLSRLPAGEDFTLPAGTPSAEDPLLARLAGDAGCRYLIVGRLVQQSDHALLELYLINVQQHTLVFDGRHPVRLSPDDLVVTPVDGKG